MTEYSYPHAVVFDLDYTLWPFWCDYHVDPPISRVTDSELKDSSGYKLALCPDVESIIRELVENNVTIISASRTPTPHIAKKVLSLIKINGKPMIEHFHSLQWGEGTKIKHISRAVQDLGLEDHLENGSFILFDDEARNRDVESIGCHFAFIEDYRRGLTRPIFENALKTWTSAQK
ncbi:magnesium-dependent phosphatase-1 [Metschnikowia bicuspidata var. bicuspidata NRRL YB-4993]|uniref:Magnesium-dependent phosphatase-1 n=1 Tax=Metschnikowia bicuspidata var. bicuspidata NRRL YB-4993 TaxID=869754 RepID=A0A1A0HHY0_9ASCO|nr:magnesium-dependent phosphatase-1 [Metschnikowia bicuspidata var. bicuspidata NRRL YB-4993]OBA23487.1 magnesium-dependent phosphatase-1 [Metschnikowia bicuspidata var. bicuspidata NRRL YB-4993]